MNKWSIYFLGVAFVFTSSVSAQHDVVEELIQQVVKDEVPSHYAYFYLLPQSYKEKTTTEIIPLYKSEELSRNDLSIINSFSLEYPTETVDWRNYNIKKVKYPTTYPAVTRPPELGEIVFVKYNMTDDTFTNLYKNKKPHVLFVKKKWFWNKKNLRKNKKFREQLEIAMLLNNKLHEEENIYFQFSKPVFSKDMKYAKVSVLKNKKSCSHGHTSVYKMVAGSWIKVMEFNPVLIQLEINS